MSAVQIYKLLEKGKYRVDLPEINKILNKAENNLVAIYSLSGPLRTGKSFMLGFFLRYLRSKGQGDWVTSDLQSTFNFRGGSERDTVGIWMWSEPFLIKKRDGTNVSVFLLDTQGLFDKETTTQNNSFVFALSTLLSSVIIYNIEKRVSEDKLDFLQYYAGIARLADEVNQDEPFQKLLFLIRDWENPNDYGFGYHDDRTPSEKNYKKDYLDLCHNQPSQNQSSREMILSTFKDVSCYLLPYPGSEVVGNSNVNVANVERGFLDYIEKFVPLVLNNEAIVAKKIGGKHITGGELIMFVKKWAEFLKSDRVPDSKTLFQATAELQNEIEKTKAINNYKKKMEAFVKGSDRFSDQDFENELGYVH